LGQQQIGLIVQSTVKKALHGMMVNKTSGLMAEEIIITWHHLQAHEFLEVWMNCIHPVCPLALFVKIK
jgi:hypothetical protein